MALASGACSESPAHPDPDIRDQRCDLDLSRGKAVDGLLGIKDLGDVLHRLGRGRGGRRRPSA